MTEHAIEITNLVKKFARFRALDDVSMQVKSGVIHGFVGPNGAGKTTAIKIIAGALSATSGSVLIKGNAAGTIEAKRLIGFLPEFPSFYSELSALNYLIFMGSVSGLTYRDSIKKASELLDFMNLTAFTNKKLSKFSASIKKKVGLAQAMIHNPEILLLDEPTANLDQTARLEIIEDIKNIVSQFKLTVLISSHVLIELEHMVSSLSFIKNGKLIIGGSLAEIRKLRKGHFTISTSNDDLMANTLLQIGIISSSSIDERGRLKIIAKKPEEFKRFVSKISYDNDIMVNFISEEDLSIDSIYKNIILGEGDE